MKNIVPVVVIVLILLGVGGYLFMNSKKGITPTGVTTSNTAVESNKVNTGGNVLTNIKDALLKSQSFTCQYPDPTGKTKITTYVKNGAIRLKNLATSSENGGEALMKDNKMWIWNETKKEGMMVTLKNTDQNGTKKNQMDEAIADMEKYKSYCKVEMVPDSMFMPPADVKFQDLDAMMQGVGQQGIPKITIEPTVEETQPTE
jgi:hypothetical protein